MKKHYFVVCRDKKMQFIPQVFDSYEDAEFFVLDAKLIGLILEILDDDEFFERFYY